MERGDFSILTLYFIMKYWKLIILISSFIIFYWIVNIRNYGYEQGYKDGHYDALRELRFKDSLKIK